jgi:GTP-sensing pleiotropic transcriptional regulator CodY
MTGNSLSSFGKKDVTTNKYSGIIFTVSSTVDDLKEILSYHETSNIFFDDLCKKISPILNKSITFLLRNREFLGYQLDYKSGNITEEEFNSIVDDYLKPPEKIDLIELKKQILLLMKITNKTFTSDELSVMLNCDIDEAEKALDLILLVK